jgi:hypothetical protein
MGNLNALARASGGYLGSASLRRVVAFSLLLLNTVLASSYAQPIQTMDIFGDNRVVQLHITPAGWSPSIDQDAINETNTPSIVYGPFNATLNRSLSVSHGGASASGSVSVSQSSLVGPTSLEFVSSFNSSAQLSHGTNSGSPRMSTTGLSPSPSVFELTEYCHFKLSGTFQASTAKTVDMNNFFWGYPGATASASIGLTSWPSPTPYNYSTNLQVTTDLYEDLPLISSGQGELNVSGFLEPGSFSAYCYADGGIGLLYADSSATANASARLSLQLTPLGTRLVGLEVIQAVQDWNNSVPLIQNKPTFVRVHVEPASAPSVPIINPLLRGFDPSTGLELPGSPLSPMNESAKFALPNAEDPDRRWDLKGSINFQLPTSWTTRDWVRLVIDMKGLQPTKRPLEQYIVFGRSPTMELRLVPITIIEKYSNATNVFLPPKFTNIVEQVTHVQEVFPLGLGSLKLSSGSLVVIAKGAAYAEVIFEQMATKRTKDLAMETSLHSPIYVGISPKVPKLKYSYDELSGLADNIPGNLVLLDGTVRFPNYTTLGHELGHVLGEFHPVNVDIFGSMVLKEDQLDPVFLPETNYAKGTVVLNTILVAPLNRAVKFPFYYRNSSDPDDVAGPFLGPIDQGTNGLVYGLTGSTTPDELFARRYDYDDIMTPGIGLMPSSFTYQRLHAAMNSRWPQESSLGLSKTLASSSVSCLFIRGLIDFGSNTVSLLPFSRISLASPPSFSASGTHTLNVYLSFASTTNLAYSIPFTPVMPKPSTTSGIPTIGYFHLPVHTDFGVIEKVEVLRDGIVLASRTRSPAAPQVQLLFPSGMETFSADSQVFAQWSATDSDGDTLTYQVQLSRDGGASWETIGIDWPTTEFPLPVATLAATTNALIKVIASDGFNVSTAQSSIPFTILNHSPQLALQSPVTNGFYSGASPVTLNVMAYDLEDGVLDGSQITWMSSRDGLLGTGSRLELKASALSEGTHQITSTATDLSAATASASVEIVISRLAKPQFQNITRSADGLYRLSFWGDTAGRQILEVSTNLTEWFPISTNITEFGPLDYVYTNDSQGLHHFFRVRSQP